MHSILGNFWLLFPHLKRLLHLKAKLFLYLEFLYANDLEAFTQFINPLSSQSNYYKKFEQKII